MKLSAPIYLLKRNARLLSRQEKIPLHDALNRIARSEGYESWSLLAANASMDGPAGKLFSQLQPGDLVLIAARPSQGKTLLGIELALEAIKSGQRSFFFTLGYTAGEVADLCRSVGAELAQLTGQFELDCSDAIDADYVMAALALASRGTLVVVDYLQLLDQKRESPELAVQIRALHSFARHRGLILVFISQISRSYDPSRKRCPDIRDLRSPNPVDLQLFSKTCFLHDGQIRFQAVR